MLNTMRNITKKDARFIKFTFLGGVIFGGGMTLIRILSNGFEQYMEEYGLIWSAIEVALGGGLGYALDASCVTTDNDNAPLFMELPQSESTIIGEIELEAPAD